MGGLVGGLLIGLAVALMLLLNGRVAGISGILGGLLTLRTGDALWRVAFVMVGALLVAVPAYRLVPKRGRPVLEEKFSLPEKKVIDAPLLGGSALFGVGWGLVGFCPGAAVAALGTGLFPVFAFVAAMLAGIALHARFFGRSG